MTSTNTVLLIHCAALIGACSRPSGERDAPIAIACRPDGLSKDERERSRALRSELAARTISTNELSLGYSFTIGADPDLFRGVAEWIALERRCCPFLSFDLRWSSGDAALPELSLTGPEGTKEFLAAEVPGLSRAEK